MLDKEHFRPSALPRIARCPGSYAASLACPPQERSEAAAHGTDLHAHMAAQTRPQDSADAALCETAWQAFQAYREDMGISKDARVWSEDTFITCIYSNVIISGTPDVVIAEEKDGVIELHIIDWKFGHEPVTPRDNEQLMAYAVAVAESFVKSGKEVSRTAHLVIIQPSLHSTYLHDTTDLFWAMERIAAIAAAAEQEHAPRYASPAACRYCPALTSCSVASASLAPVSQDMALADMPPARREELLERVKLAEKLCERIKAEAESLLAEDPHAIPGWTLAPGATRRSVDIGKAWDIASAQGVTPQEMLSICSVPAGKLESTLTAKIQAAQGGTKKAATEAAKALMEPCTTTSQNKPSLKQIKK